MNALTQLLAKSDEPAEKKKCTKCGEVKSFTDFCKSTHKKDGLQSWCYKCKEEGQIKYINTEKGYLKYKYHHIKKSDRLYRQYGRKLACNFTFDEFFAAFEKLHTSFRPYFL